MLGSYRAELPPLRSTPGGPAGTRAGQHDRRLPDLRGSARSGALCSIGIASAENAPMDWPGPLTLLEGLAGGWLVLTLWCLAGAVLAVAFRNVALPIGLGVVWILGIETLLAGVDSSLLPDLEVLSDAMPGANAGALVFSVTGMNPADAPPGVRDAVSGDRALLTVLGYVAVFVVLAVATTRRRDVS